MKITNIFILTVLLVSKCNGQQEINDPFTSKKISRTASFVANANIDEVFPLFGAFEERKWISTWNPILIYPNEEVITEGTAFKTIKTSHENQGESEYLWIVTKYEPQNHFIQYLVSNNNRFWTIDVKNDPILNDAKTKITVTYTFTGLNTIGNKLNQQDLEGMYKYNLKNWEELLNDYLKERG